MKIKKLPFKAHSEKGDLFGEVRLGEHREPMNKNRIEVRDGASRGRKQATNRSAVVFLLWLVCLRR